MKRINEREGFVSVVADGSRITLQGLPVMGYGQSGELRNRLLLIDQDSPDWFRRLCFKYANSAFLVKVRVVGLAKGHLAFVKPVAESEQEALSQWQERRGEFRLESRPQQATPGEFALRAHELIAQKQGISITSHHVDGMKTFSSAVDDKGRLFKIVGGAIVEKVRDNIESHKTTFEKECDRFIRVKPYQVC